MITVSYTHLDVYKRQDWDRCVDTTDPKYYKWTQWIFLQLYKHGLAYKTTMPVNWCTSCKCCLLYTSFLIVQSIPRRREMCNCLRLRGPIFGGTGKIRRGIPCIYRLVRI